MPYNHVYLTEDYSGTALWAPPGCWRASLRQQLKLAPEIVRVTGARGCLPRQTRATIDGSAFDEEGSIQ